MARKYRDRDKSRPELFLVERDNEDTKKFKIIHPWDGRLTPLLPGILKRASRRLAEKLNLDGVDYIVGFAEGGILSAYGVSDVTGIPLVGSYRVKLKAPNEIHFREPHSMRADHYVYGLEKGSCIVVVEDEITTGSTLINAVNEFNLAGVRVQDVGAFVMLGNVENVEKLKKYGLEVKCLYTYDDIYKPSEGHRA